MGRIGTLMDLTEVGELIGVARQTVSQYLSDSKPGGRYGHHPFPAPSRRIGRAPVWAASRRKEIQRWADARPGHGVGGGRPAHDS